jgi:pyruvate dehydrogenase E1 component beta subunit
VRRTGGDVTVVAVGYLAAEALKAAETAAAAGIDVEVIDPRTLWPLDIATIVESVRKTGRLVVADDANRLCGFAGELVSQVTEAVDLRSRPIRVTRGGFVVPYARELERELIPGADQILDAIRTSTAAAAVPA